MALARLTKQCHECPFVETCEHKEMEALGYLPEPIMADVKVPVTAEQYSATSIVIIFSPFSGSFGFIAADILGFVEIPFLAQCSTDSQINAGTGLQMVVIQIFERCI